ncbi:hypothetical protein [Roseateles sp.]|uniref:hypothetical protein n=1 Tax=Roseateles sp. TaxID=1971397 RepID=UPI0035A18AA9
MLWALTLAAALAVPASADQPSAPSAKSSESISNRLVTKTVRVEGRRNWEGSYAAASATRRIDLFCLKSDTGRCGFRIVDGHMNKAGAIELQVEWIGLPTGGSAQRTLSGESYAVCVRSDVGDDKGCQPTSALTPF